MSTDIFQAPHVEAVPRTALSIAETALSIGVSERTIQRMISEGALPVVHLGKRRLVPVDLLRKWLYEQAQNPVTWN